MIYLSLWRSFVFNEKSYPCQFLCNLLVIFVPCAIMQFENLQRSLETKTSLHQFLAILG